METVTDVVVVGAGLAGLACARELSRAQRNVVVIERARGVGGRCATRRIEGQPVDHGVVFLHGTDADFISDIESISDGKTLWGWPQRVVGKGAPCQPEAFADNARRWAFAEGATVLAKHLARGLKVELGKAVLSVTCDAGRLVVRGTDDAVWRAPTVVLAQALEESVALVEPLVAQAPELSSSVHLLRMLGSHPCLTLVAGYPRGLGGPEWDVCFPEESPFLLISHDSAKRAAAHQTIMVYQALPCWSLSNFDVPAEAWGAELLAAAGRVVGDWAAQPAWQQPHRWRFARADRGMELTRPLLIPLAQGGQVGMTGEVFHPGGGVQGAWQAGRALARRLLGDTE